MSEAEHLNDPLLAPLFTGADSERALRDVLTHEAVPEIDRTLRYEVGVFDARETDDITADVLLRLVAKLQKLVVRPQVEPIGRFRRYVRTVTHHLVRDHEQRNHPELGRLSNRVRYVLSHTPGLAVWAADRAVCGWASWRGRVEVPIRLPDPFNPAAVESARLLRPLLLDILKLSGGPLALRELVFTLARAGQLPPEPFVSATTLDSRSLLTDPLVPIHGRQYLSELWLEITELPIRQRVSLLLQLRLENGESVAHLLAAMGIADFLAQASALQMDPPEFHELWRELPLSDARIGAMLEATRQQVINLRKSARDRLARHMGRPR